MIGHEVRRRGNIQQMKYVIPFAAMSLAACAASTPQPADTAVPPPSVQQSATGDISGRTLGTSLYGQLKSQPGDLLVSPMSILGAFGVVAAGAQGETRSAILDSLHLPGESNLDADLGGLLRTLQRSDDGATLTIANALWVQEGFALRPDFVRTVQADYGASADHVDFLQAPEAAVERINGWVTKRTGDRIKHLISRDAINDRTRLVVTNAVYFLGDWRSPFNASDTTEQPFHLGNGTTRPIPLMYQKAGFRYLDTDSFQALDLPYKDERLSMTVLLPKDRGGLPALEAQLGTGLSSWLSRLDATEARTVRTFLPKVQMELAYDLIPSLTAMGMGVAFTSAADFGGIADADLAIGHVIHKTFLRIDEKGTEAAAATGLTVEVQSAPVNPPPVFRADHPFLFLIRDRESGAILFLGRVAAPSRPSEG